MKCIFFENATINYFLPLSLTLRTTALLWTHLRPQSQFAWCKAKRSTKNHVYILQPRHGQLKQKTRSCFSWPCPECPHIIRSRGIKHLPFNRIYSIWKFKRKSNQALQVKKASRNQDVSKYDNSWYSRTKCIREYKAHGKRTYSKSRKNSRV